MTTHTVTADDSTIALIGMAVRVPGAASLDQFWENLVNGIESIERFGAERRERSLFDNGPLAPNERDGWVGAAGILSDADHFDAAFFGYSPRDALLLDPQQRIFLECAWEALEHAAYDPSRAPTTGVFAGAGANSYIFNVVSNRKVLGQLLPHQLLVSQDKDFLATRVSYHFELTGPSLSIQTACSTSLVATHVACQSLLSRECDLALAGGVSIAAAQRAGYVPLQGAILAPDGYCRAFDAAAGGTVPGNGAGVVVLKRYNDAIRDGDTIHALILGSAINNDGKAKAGFTAPSADQQAAVIAEALAVARMPPEAIGYIEAHGTGTQLGDPIEVAALAKVFRPRHDQTVCWIGSVKPNIGHLDAASGVIGLIKATLAVREGVIPPTLNFTRPNPKLELERTPFAVAERTTQWDASGGTRCAGVSSFGIGGTNAHVVIAQVEPALATSRRDQQCVFPLSARTASALVAAANRLADHLSRPHPPQIDDIACTLALGRHTFSHRRALVVRDHEDAVAQLTALRDLQPPAAGVARVAFLFPGQGSQYVQMGKALARIAPVFREELRRCTEQLSKGGVDLLAALMGDEAQLRDTRLAQPAIFSVAWALSRQLEAWGVVPTCMLGHSVGEYVAACIAGVISLEDSLRLVADRGRLMAKAPPGAMLAVIAAREVLIPLVESPCVIAAENAPDITVLSGPEPAIELLALALHRRGIASRRLATSHAFHGPMMEQILPPFRECLAGIKLHAPQIPYISSSTGLPISADETTNPEYWVQQIRRPVKFSDALGHLSERCNILVEVGPGRALTALVDRQLSRERYRSVATLAGRDDEDRSALQAVATLWELGIPVAWNALVPTGSRRVPLPSYPFERRKYWLPLAALETDDGVNGQESWGDTVDADGAPSHEIVAADRTAMSTAFIAARSETERALATIWSELLGIREVGIRDDFFELRGDSLLATQLVLRVRAKFGVDLPLRAIFEARTIEALAGRVAAYTCVAAPPAEIARRERGLHVPLSFAQQRLWFLHQIDPQSPAYNLTFAVRALGPLDLDVLGRCIDEITIRHESLRTVVVEDAGRPLGLVQQPRPLAIELEPAMGLAAALARASEETLRSFDLAHGPLLRVRVLRLSAADHVVVFSVHHIAFDIWSCTVFVRELLALYAAFVAGTPSPLPPLAVGYPDFAAWQHENLNDEVCQREVAHWRAALGATSVRVALPPDHDVVPTTWHGAGQVAYLPPALTARALDLARTSGTTLFAVLMTTYAVLLRHRSGAADLVIGTDVANRTRVEVEPLIGFFVNQVAIRLDLAASPTMSSVLSLVHDVALNAFAHQDMPFDRVVAGLNPSRGAGRSPLFDTKLVLRNVRFPDLAVGGVKFEVLDLERRTTAFDFLLTCGEVDDRLRLEVEYSIERYENATVKRFLADFEVLLAATVEHPDATLADLCATVDSAAAARQTVATERAYAAAAESLREFAQGDPFDC